MMQQLASSVCCRRLSWKLRRSREEVVASMRKRSRDSNGIWLATWRRVQGFSKLGRAVGRDHRALAHGDVVSKEP